ncbi:MULTISPECIES: putative 2-aminoethylphosphonate ABC transporter substrate-binding protein [unclassified Clostridium]|uniref:putative 2-aminoethylphosphonate ABC transporter substrate-binding protein n=1 Tax=unclassified Clostridium TaxID=2614128 RepID=UPI0013FBFF19|nr:MULTISPECIES: putative 2-aminoethylphosphonate ABC transporter substrate-binding protein [unclassified Clostridium]NFT06915.1 putative 2-aminoethylphosphonate ABC transporter substrate-binding protein [Clostridium botulinum]
MRRRGYTLLCIFIIFASIFLGCGKSNESNELTVYTTIEDEFLQEYLNAFKSKNPDVKLNIVRDSNGIIISKLMAEKDNSKADIVWGVAASNLSCLDKEGILQEYSPIGLENINEKFVDSNNKIPHWVGLNVWTTIFTVNKDEAVKKGIVIPKYYEDLLKSEYNGEIVMPNPESSGTGYFTVAAWIQMMGEENAWKFMDKLNKNIKSYQHSGAMPTKLAATGENVIGIGMDFQSLREEEKIPQITTIFPAEGLPWDIETVALIKKGNIKPEAKAFMDWTISSDAMEAYSKNKGIVTMNSCKSKVQGYPSDFSEKLINNDFNWMSENRERIIKEWNRRYGESK